MQRLEPKLSKNFCEGAGNCLIGQFIDLVMPIMEVIAPQGNE